MTIQEPREGMRVTYLTPYSEQKGIIKRTCDDPDYVFVVYYCAGDWDNYKNYTAARTLLSDLQEGWKEEEEPTNQLYYNERKQNEI